MNTRKQVVSFFRNNGNKPATYSELIEHVESWPALPRVVEEMFLFRELERVDDENRVLYRMTADGRKAKT
jgi:hypothetical protein